MGPLESWLRIVSYDIVRLRLVTDGAREYCLDFCDEARRLFVPLGGSLHRSAQITEYFPMGCWRVVWRRRAKPRHLLLNT